MIDQPVFSFKQQESIQQHANNLQSDLQGIIGTSAQWINDSIDLNQSNPSIQVESFTDVLPQQDIKVVETAPSAPQSSIEAISLIGESLVSYTIPSSSSSQGQYCCIKNLLNNCQNTYQPHLKNMVNFYEKIKNYSQKSLDNISMYKQFFKAKWNQQYSYFQQRTSPADKRILNNQLYNYVYVNAKMALNQLLQTRKKQIDKGMKLVQVISNCQNIIQSKLKQITKNRKDQERKIQILSTDLLKLNQQIEKVIKDRINKQQVKHKDRYLENRLLINSQKNYINRIYQLNKNIIKYFNTIIIQEQHSILLIIKNCLKQYCKAYTQCYPNIKFDSKLLIGQQNSFQKVLEIQLSDLIYNSIPKKFQFIYGSSPQKLDYKSLLFKFNKQLNEEIYFPVMQLIEDYVLHKCKVMWVPTSKPKLEIDIIVTLDGFIHMEKNNNISTLKLTELKIIQKGKDIHLMDRGMGVLGYLIGNLEIGKLQFFDEFDLEAFMKVIQKWKRK